MGGWDGTVRSLARGTLAPVWSFPTGGAVISRPEVDETTVYAGSTDTKVYAINKAGGTQKWAFPTGGPVQAHPLLADGAVFVGSGDHYLYAIEAATGQQRWKYLMNLHCQAKPAFMDGTIFVGAWDNKFYALNARTGALKWQVTIGSIINYAPAVTSPCAVNGKIIVTAAPDPGAPNVRCLDAATGKLLWSQRLSNGASPYGSPATDGSHVFFATLEGSIH
jgi:outer membrane protein assembly factor BamB